MNGTRCLPACMKYRTSGFLTLRGTAAKIQRVKRNEERKLVNKFHGCGDGILLALVIHASFLLYVIERWRPRKKLRVNSRKEVGFVKKADIRIHGSNVYIKDCTIVIKDSSNSSIDKLKGATVAVICVIVTLGALVVSRYYPELLPDFIRLAISVAIGN